jgi:hypothetical protein
MIRERLIGKGFRVGTFNGEDKSGLEAFKTRKVDVLIGSSALGTGVDGLQFVCNRLIVNCLPWTSAGYEQLLGRYFSPRQHLSRRRGLYSSGCAAKRGRRLVVGPTTPRSHSLKKRLLMLRSMVRCPRRNLHRRNRCLRKPKRRLLPGSSDWPKGNQGGFASNPQGAAPAR